MFLFVCSEDSAERLVPSKNSALNLASAVSKPNITKNEKLAKGKAIPSFFGFHVLWL